jgi:GTP-binding protein Era
VAELIRERILLETGEEVPYASAVVVERFEEPQAASRSPLTRISAVIYCERSGQKAILIGKGGSKLKSIGAAARKEIESLLGTRVYLELHVIVEENWRESRYFVDSLDWRKQLEDLAQPKPDSEEEPLQRTSPSGVAKGLVKTGRVPQVRPSVPGPKKKGEAPPLRLP